MYEAEKKRCVRATLPFAKGAFVVEYEGDLLITKEAKIRKAAYSNKKAGCYMYHFIFKGKQFILDATKESGRLGWLVSHSRSGNYSTRVVDINSYPYLILVAAEEIAAGDELAFDYADHNQDAIDAHRPWFDEKCKETITDRKKALHTFNTNPTSENLNSFRIFRAKA